MQETQVPSLRQEDSLEKEMATHSSILAWKIPWTEEPSGLQSMGSQRVRHLHVSLHRHPNVQGSGVLVRGKEITLLIPERREKGSYDRPTGCWEAVWVCRATLPIASLSVTSLSTGQAREQIFLWKLVKGLSSLHRPTSASQSQGSTDKRRGQEGEAYPGACTPLSHQGQGTGASVSLNPISRMQERALADRYIISSLTHGIPLRLCTACMAQSWGTDTALPSSLTGTPALGLGLQPLPSWHPHPYPPPVGGRPHPQAGWVAEFGSGCSGHTALSTHCTGFARWKPFPPPLIENKVEFIILQFFKTA